jgi:hypothetical protein
MLLPVVNSGFISDDSYNSLGKGTIMYYYGTESRSIVDSIKLVAIATMDTIKYYISTGRFLPVHYALLNFCGTFLSNLILYKICIIIFVAINIIIFSYLIKLLTGCSSLALMSILLSPLFLQLRLYHDPVLSFYFVMQFLFLVITLSIIFLIYYLKYTKLFYLFVSLFFYLLSMLTYEISYTFFIIFLIIIYYYKNDIYYTFRLSSLFILLSILCLSIVVFIRTYLGVPIIETSNSLVYWVANPNIKLYLITFIKQTTAAFPLSYFFANIFAHRSSISFDPKNFFSVATISIAGIYLFLYIAIAQKLKKELSDKRSKPFNLRYLLILGLLLFVLPAIMIPLVPKYQEELVWGTGYIPIYISYFGLLLVAICILYKIYSSLSFNNILAASLIISFLFSAVGALTYCSNVTVVENSNYEWLYPRVVIQDALKDGLFKFVPDNSVLLVDNDNRHLWEIPQFYIMYSGVRLKSVGSTRNPEGYISDDLPRSAIISQNQENSTYEFSENSNIFYLKYFSQWDDKGYAILGSIKNLSASDENLYEVTSKNVHIYVHQAGPLDSLKRISVGGYWAEDSQSPIYEPFIFSKEEMKLDASGEDWMILSISKENKIIDLQSMFLALDP